MSVSVDLEDLLATCEWVSGGEAAGMDADAYVSRGYGKIHWCGEGVDEAPPEDIEDGSLYVAVPSKNELGLGRSLALRFVEEHLPDSTAEVEGFFRRRGAYARFKSMLDQAGCLDDWHQYEQKAREHPLDRWCAEHGFTASRDAAGS